MSGLLVVASLDTSPCRVSKQVLFDKTNSEIHRKLSRAFAVFEKWPNSFHNLVDRHFSRATQRTNGLRDALNLFKYRRIIIEPGLKICCAKSSRIIFWITGIVN